MSIEIDLSYLQNLEDSFEGIMVKMLNDFSTKIPDSIQKVQQFLKEGEYRALADELHILKQTVGYVGLTDFQHYLEDCFREIENGNHSSFTSENLNYISEVCESALEAIQKEVENRSS